MSSSSTPSSSFSGSGGGVGATAGANASFGVSGVTGDFGDFGDFGSSNTSDTFGEEICVLTASILDINFTKFILPFLYAFTPSFLSSGVRFSPSTLPSAISSW